MAILRLKKVFTKLFNLEVESTVEMGQSCPNLR